LVILEDTIALEKKVNNCLQLSQGQSEARVLVENFFGDNATRNNHVSTEGTYGNLKRHMLPLADKDQDHLLWHIQVPSEDYPEETDKLSRFNLFWKWATTRGQQENSSKGSRYVFGDLVRHSGSLAMSPLYLLFFSYRFLSWMISSYIKVSRMRIEAFSVCLLGAAI
jgi:hypothetical protein